MKLSCTASSVASTNAYRLERWPTIWSKKADLLSGFSCAIERKYDWRQYGSIYEATAAFFSHSSQKGAPFCAALIKTGACAGLPAHVSPIRTVGHPAMITPPCAVLSPIREAGEPPMKTPDDPLTIVSGGPVQTHISPRRAAGSFPTRTVGSHAGRIGPPTCGTGPGLTAGHTCMSPIRAPGIPIDIRPFTQSTLLKIELTKRKAPSSLKFRKMIKLTPDWQSGRAVSIRSNFVTSHLLRLPVQRVYDHVIHWEVDTAAIDQITFYIHELVKCLIWYFWYLHMCILH